MIHSAILIHLSPKVNTNGTALRISSVMHKEATQFDIFSGKKEAPGLLAGGG